MQANAVTITKFYTAFAQLDGDGMDACYADGVAFEDEVFTLQGKAQTMGMWRMLIGATRAKGLDAWRLEFSDVVADATTGQAHWDAQYRFSATGRMVLNRIEAQFTFDPQGLIITHRDSFNFWSWSSQALGAPGVLLGWSPFLRNKVRQQAAGNLQKFMAGRTTL
jgi:hypothetical protein